MKNKNVTIFIAVIAITLIGLAGYVKIGQKESSTISAEGIPEGSQESTNSHTAGVNNVNNVLTVEETFYDFGTISMKNGLASKIFKVSNSSTGDINLEKLTTSCMCTTAYIIKDGIRSRPFGMPGHGGAVPKANEIIKSGETRSIEVVYDPNAHGPAGVGMVDRFVYLEDSSGTVLQLEIKANVTP
jgi:hypothetical protein